MSPWPRPCRCWTSTTVWWWHLMPLARGSIPSNKDAGRMWLSLECTCCNRFRYSSQSIWEGFNKTMWRRWNGIISARAWTLNTGTCWPTKWMANTPLVTPTCSLQHRNWKDRQKLEIPCSQRLPWLEDQMWPDHRHQRTCFPLGSWRVIIPSWLNPL